MERWTDFLDHSGKLLPCVIPHSKFILMLFYFLCGPKELVYKTDSLKNKKTKHASWPYSLFCNGTGASLFVSQDASKLRQQTEPACLPWASARVLITGCNPGIWKWDESEQKERNITGSLEAFLSEKLRKLLRNSLLTKITLQ